MIFLIENILIVKFLRIRRLDIVYYVTKKCKINAYPIFLYNSSALEEISNARRENNIILSLINRKTGEIRPSGGNKYSGNEDTRTHEALSHVNKNL